MMEKRNYAAIALLVFGIIEVHSFSQGSDTNDYGLSSEVFGDGELRDPYLQAMTLDHESAGRVRRNKNDNERNKAKEAKLADIRRRLRIEESREEVVRQGVEAHRAAVEQYEAMIDDYMRHGRSRSEAIALIRRRNPALYNQLHP